MKSTKNIVLRPKDKKAIRKEVSNAIKAGRTVPYDLRTLIESKISLDRIRKVYRKKNPTKLQLRRWLKMPNIFDVSNECREKMWKKGMVV